MKNKKQHYVPQFYLKNFSFDNESLYVFNGNNFSFYKSSIKDLCEQNNFYKFDMSWLRQLAPEDDNYNLIDKKIFELINKNINELSENDINKFELSLENYFSSDIENNLKSLISKILVNLKTNNVNQPFIVVPDKRLFSHLLAIQYYRTLFYRTVLSDALCDYETQKNKIINQYYGFPIPEKNLNISMSKAEQEYFHLLFITNDKEIAKLEYRIYVNPWILLVNQTQNPIICNDVCISSYCTEKEDIYQGHSVGAYGMISIFPLSTNCSIIIFDKNKFENILNGKTIFIREEHIIQELNEIIFLNTHRFLFSCNEKYLKEFVKYCINKFKIKKR